MRLLFRAKCCETLILRARLVIAAAVFLISLVPHVISRGSDPVLPSASDEGSISNLVAVVKKEIGQPVLAHVSMGEVRPATNRKYKLKLRNETSEIIEFDNIATGCKCVDVQTSKGSIEPLDTAVVEFGLKVDANPRAIENGGSMFFRQGDRLVFQLRYVYRVSDYVGFSGSLALVTAPKNSISKKPIEFTVPLVAGVDVDPSRVGIILDGITGEFSFEVKPAGQVVNCKLDIAEGEFDRLYGSA